MTAVGPFTLTGTFGPRQVAAVRELISRPFPWHVLLPSPLYTGFNSNPAPFSIHFDPDATTYLAGILRGSTVNIWGPWSEPEDHYQGGGPWAIAHEVGHAVDKTLFRPARHLRNDVHEIMHGGAAHEHLVETRDVPNTDEPNPDGLHGWSGSGRTAHTDAPSEAFAEWFAWRLGYHARASYGPHTWHSPTQQSAIEEIVMAAAEQVQVFADVGPDSVHRDAVEWAAGLGLVGGREDGTFGPYEPVTRAQLVTVLRAYHELAG